MITSHPARDLISAERIRRVLTQTMRCILLLHEHLLLLHPFFTILNALASSPVILSPRLFLLLAIQRPLKVHTSPFLFLDLLAAMKRLGDLVGLALIHFIIIFIQRRGSLVRAPLTPSSHVERSRLDTQPLSAAQRAGLLAQTRVRRRALRAGILQPEVFFDRFEFVLGLIVELAADDHLVDGLASHIQISNPARHRADSNLLDQLER